MDSAQLVDPGRRARGIQRRDARRPRPIRLLGSRHARLAHLRTALLLHESDPRFVPGFYAVRGGTRLLHDRPREPHGGRRGMEQDHVAYCQWVLELSLIHISEPTRLGMISYAVFCL